MSISLKRNHQRKQSLFSNKYFVCAMVTFFYAEPKRKFRVYATHRFKVTYGEINNLTGSLSFITHFKLLGKNLTFDLCHA